MGLGGGTEGVLIYKVMIGVTGNLRRQKTRRAREGRAPADGRVAGRRMRAAYDRSEYWTNVSAGHGNRRRWR